MIEDTAGYKEMMRMNYGDFCEILRKIEPFITPQELLGGAKVVKAPERLITLAIRFMATGETFRSLSFQFRISIAAISFCLDIGELNVELPFHFLVSSLPSISEVVFFTIDIPETSMFFQNVNQ